MRGMEIPVQAPGPKRACVGLCGAFPSIVCFVASVRGGGSRREPGRCGRIARHSAVKGVGRYLEDGGNGVIAAHK
jgi:hypothetical protein